MVCKVPLTLSLSPMGRGDARIVLLTSTGAAANSLSPWGEGWGEGVFLQACEAVAGYRKEAGIMSATMARNTMAPKP